MSFLQAGVHLAFLSARPESVRGLTEAESFKNIFNPLLKRGELYCSPVLLLGSIHSGPTALLRFMLGNRWVSPREQSPAQHSPACLPGQLFTVVLFFWAFSHAVHVLPCLQALLTLKCVRFALYMTWNVC